MYGDKLYCMNCGKVFLDTWVIHDTRYENVLNNCPKCNCMHVVNATYYIEKTKNRKKRGGAYDKEFYKLIKNKINSFDFKPKKRAEIYYRSCNL